MAVQIAAYAGPGGEILADFSPDLISCEWSYNEHGCQVLEAEVAMGLAESWRWYAIPGLVHVQATAHGRAVWAGRLDSVALTGAGVRITALGYIVALNDVPYTALWMTQRYNGTVSGYGNADARAYGRAGAAGRQGPPDINMGGRSRVFIPPPPPPLMPITDDDNSSYNAAQWEVDTNNRIYIAPRKNETYSASTRGGWSFHTPDDSTRDINYVAFSYSVTLQTNWIMRLVRLDRDTYSGGTSLWTLNGNGASQTGTQTITLATPKPHLAFYLETPNTSTAYTSDTGTDFGKITSLIISTGGVSFRTNDIVEDILGDVTGVNADQVRSTTKGVQAADLDLDEYVYEDAAPLSIIDGLALISDTLSSWRVWVGPDRVLRFESQTHDRRDWYVDDAALDLERTSEGLVNSAYAVYTDERGIQRRTAIDTTPRSIDRAGMTIRRAVSASTTSDTNAEVARDRFLSDFAVPQPDVSMVLREITTPAGAPGYLWDVKPGDTITLRALPAYSVGTVDKIRRVTVTSTRYNPFNNTLGVGAVGGIRQSRPAGIIYLPPPGGPQ